MRIPSILFVSLVLIGAKAHAAPLQAGEYLTEGGWARLLVSPAVSGKFAFTIASQGPNGHSCDLGGEIVNGQSRLEAKGLSPCVVKFAVHTDHIEVSNNESEACRTFCGARAGFSAKYLPVSAECGEAGRDSTRKAFKRLYDQKAYAQALAKLQPLLATCSATLDDLETGWLRNDIAITQHKLKQYAACLATLEPLAKDARKTDEQIKEDLLPVDALNYLPIVRATRTNLRLCTAGR